MVTPDGPKGPGQVAKTRASFNWRGRPGFRLCRWPLVAQKKTLCELGSLHGPVPMVARPVSVGGPHLGSARADEQVLEAAGSELETVLNRLTEQADEACEYREPSAVSL